MTARANQQREAVLVVCHPDGYLQAFAEPHVDVHFATSLDVPPSGEAFAEQYLEMHLPWRFKRVFWPGMVRNTHLLERLTPQQAAYRKEMVEFVRYLLKGKESK